MSSGSIDERGRRDGTNADKCGDDQPIESNINVSNTTRVRSLGSASGVFPTDVLESPPATTFPTTANLPDPMQLKTNHVGSVVAGICDAESEDENASHSSVVLNETISKALETPTTDRRVADATSEILGRRLDFTTEDALNAKSDIMAGRSMDASASTPATGVTAPTTPASGNDDD